MIAYRKFSDSLKGEVHTPTSPKPSNAPKVVRVAAVEPPSLGGLGTLGESEREFQNPQRAPDTWTDVQEERAAIAEHDGGAPRAWAEALAWLDPNKPPGDVPPRRWLQFIDDCGRFIDDGWAPCAEALGWTSLDLFGCNRAKPFGRINHAGLIWLLNGRKILALGTNAATIATLSGARLTFRKCANEPGCVLAWELSPAP